MDLTVFQIGYESGQRIIEKVFDIENIELRELTELLASVVKTPKETQEKVSTFRRHKKAA